MIPRPRPVQGDLAALPAALRPLTLHPRWGAWLYVRKPKSDDWTKVPYQPHAQHLKARNNDLSTWGAYERALGVAKQGDFARYGGIGYCLLNGAIAAFDLDHCVDPATKAIAPWAQDLVRRAATYAELTPSGEGLRIIGLTAPDSAPAHRRLTGGDLPPEAGCEAYRKCPRYICITGLKIDQAPDALANIDRTIDEVLAQYDGGVAPRSASHGSAAPELAFAAAILPVDLDALRIDPNLRDTIRHDATPKGGRSEVVFGVLCALAEAGVSIDAMRSIILDPANGISAHVLDQPKCGSRYAARQVERAVHAVRENAQALVEMESPEALAQLQACDIRRADMARRLRRRNPFTPRRFAPRALPP